MTNTEPFLRLSTRAHGCRLWILHRRLSLILVAFARAMTSGRQSGGRRHFKEGVTVQLLDSADLDALALNFPTTGTALVLTVRHVLNGTHHHMRVFLENCTGSRWVRTFPYLQAQRDLQGAWHQSLSRGPDTNEVLCV